MILAIRSQIQKLRIYIRYPLCQNINIEIKNRLNGYEFPTAKFSHCNHSFFRSRGFSHFGYVTISFNRCSEYAIVWKQRIHCQESCGVLCLEYIGVFWKIKAMVNDLIDKFLRYVFCE